MANPVLEKNFGEQAAADAALATSQETVLGQTGPTVTERMTVGGVTGKTAFLLLLVVGAVLVEGARAPWLVTEAMVRRMPAGSVIVDVSIDQGGCVETSRPSSHSDPVYRVHDVIHYSVTNMPGAYPLTSTIAMTTATLPYVQTIATGGIDAVLRDTGFAKGINIRDGRIECQAVAEAYESQ